MSAGGTVKVGGMLMMVNEQPSELTYGDIYKKFCEWSPERAKMVVDYRPWGSKSIVVWLQNKMAYKVKYIDDSRFVVQALTKADIDKKFGLS